MHGENAVVRTPMMRRLTLFIFPLNVAVLGYIMNSSLGNRNPTVFRLRLVHFLVIPKSASMKLMNIGLKFFGSSLCIICFLALCWEQLMAYLKRNKGLSQELVKVDDRKFPVIVICLDEAYLSKDADILDEDAYEKNLRNFSAELKGRMVTDYSFAPIKDFKVI